MMERIGKQEEMEASELLRVLEWLKGATNAPKVNWIESKGEKRLLSNTVEDWHNFNEPLEDFLNCQSVVVTMHDCKMF